MPHVRRAVPLAVVVLALAAASSVTSADRRFGVEAVATKARVVHPGSLFPVTGDVAPAPGPFGRAREVEVVALGVLERDGKFRGLGALGRRRVGPNARPGSSDASVPASVPAAAGTGRLHYTLVTADHLPRLPAPDPEQLAQVGVVQTVDVVPAPNLAVREAEVVGTPAPGTPVRVRWTVARTTTGLVGPVTVTVRFVAPPGTASRAASPVTASLPEGLPDEGVLTREVTLPWPARTGPHATIEVRVAYDGDVATDVSDDERTVEVNLPGAPEPPPSPAPPPVPPEPGTLPPPEPPPAGVRVGEVTFAPPTASPGDTVLVTVEMRNEGRTADTRAVGWIVLVDASGHEVNLRTSVRAGAIRPGASRRVQVPAVLPDDVPPGSYRVAVRLSGPGRPAGDADGAATAPLSVTPRPLADLVVRFSRPPTSPLRPGARFAVPYEVMNRGGTPAAGFDVALLLVTDRGEKVLDAEPLRDALGPGATREGRLEAEIPADLGSGRVRLRLAVDREGRVPESDEGDNTADADVAIEVAKPNLLIASLTVEPASVAPGEAARVLAVVRNAGDAAAGPFQVAFQALGGKAGPTIDLGSTDVPGLAAGAQTRVERTASLPADAPPRHYAVAAKADAGNTVAESDETDNAFVVAGALQVAVPPPAPALDLVVRHLALASGEVLAPAAPAGVRVEVANAGAQPAPAFDVALVLATRERVERTRKGWKGAVSEVARTTVPAGVPPRGAVARALEGRVPSRLPPGRYWLVAVVDPERVLPMPSRGDDAMAVAVDVEARAVLVASPDRLPLDAPDVRTGEAFGVRTTVRNDGNAPSAAGTVDLRLTWTGPRRRENLERSLLVLPLPALRPGESLALAFSPTVPGDLPKGRHRLVVRFTSPGAAPVDLAEGVLGVRPGGVGLALGVYEGRVAPAHLRAGGGVRVTARVANLGDGPTPATMARLELAAGPILRPLADAPVPALAPGASVEVAFHARLPREVAPGRTWLSIRIDPAQAIPQTDHQDDVTWVFVDVEGRFDRDVRLDWRDLGVAGYGRVAPGEPLDVRGGVGGFPDQGLDGTEVEALLQAPDGSSRSLGRRILAGPVSPGALSAFAERFRVPSDVPPGPYVLRLVLDPDRDLPWPDSGPAGVGEIPVEVVGAPSDRCDLAIEGAADEGSAGRRLRLGVDVANRGGATAAAFDVVLYLNSPAAGGGALRLPLAALAVPAGSLRGGARTHLSFDADVPEDVPAGDYQALLVADPDGRADPRDGPERRARLDVRVGVVTGVARPPEPVAPPVPPSPPPVAPPSPPPLVPTPPPVLPPATAPPTADPSGLPIALAALLSGNALTRERGDSATFLVAYPTDAAEGSFLEVGLETGGATLPLGEFDVPVGVQGTTGAVRARLRLPSSAAVGPATLAVVVRGAKGAARPPLRLAITVR